MKVDLGTLPTLVGKGLAALAAWIWKWLTVLAVLVLASVPPLLAELDSLSGLDLAAVLPPDQASKIVFAVAIVKTAGTVTIMIAQAIRRRASPRDVPPEAVS